MGFDPKYCGTVLLVLMFAARALAAPSPAERETARSLMIEGDKLRAAGDLESALARFQAAHAIMHVPTTGLALAEMQAALGLLVEARSTALELLGQVPAEAEPPVFTSARRAAASLAAKLEPRVCTLETKVTPAIAPYTLQIDAAELPSAARTVPFKLNPGKHTLRIHASGYRPQTRDVELREGATERISFELLAEATKDAPARVVRAGPATVPLRVAEPAADDPGHAGRVRGAVALGVGGAVLAAGLVTGTLSWLTTSRERERCDSSGQCDAARAGPLARANTLANVSNVAVPIGVLGLAYGIYELLTAAPAPAERAHASVQLQLTPQGALLRGEL